MIPRFFGFPRPRLLIAFNLVLVALFWMISPAEAPLWLVVGIQSARASTSLMVAIIYGHAIWQLRNEMEAKHGYSLVIGIWIAFVADLYSSLMSMLWRVAGMPPWQNSPGWLFPPFLTALAALHHIAVPETVDNRVPRRNVIWAGVAIGLAVLAVGIYIGTQLRPGLLHLI